MNVVPSVIFERARFAGWRSGRLLAMLFLSLVAHVLLAYAVLVREPTPTVRWPQDARIALATPSGPHQQLFDWVANNDPANVFLPSDPGQNDLGLVFAPSFREARADLRAAVEPRPKILLPNLRGPADPEGWFRFPSVASRSLSDFQIALYAKGDHKTPEAFLHAFAFPEEINLKEVQRPTRLHFRRAEKGPFSMAVVIESSGSVRFDDAARDELARLRGAGSGMMLVEARLALKKEGVGSK
ncbi:MAG: hypothetical protein SNJ52_01865 [Verrucomicrobiia bacterium]